ncbi:S41 family peptidase [Lachnospiraceae bacterium MD1]|uniref:S41 family peptidase n=1 Tax=Variimorphobacter saccharofermentans TaxID=2755051 RepID=A0A839K4A8_9FIRM|nr:S41 family peptidase [Variimorphobacter saccharofermentans]MBB2184208.1 S41 family peptidase [Variimorphobacter saccharofermentans]
MKKNFITGMITGICGAALLFSVLGAVLLFGNGMADGDSKDYIAEATEEREADDSEEISAAQGEHKYDEIVKKLAFLEMLVDNYYLEKVDQVNFEDGIYKGFISSLKDPYSTYYTHEEYEALMEGASGVYCGIGATVSQNIDTGIITIVKPFVNGPAYKAGLLPGDIIYKVEGEEVTGNDLSEVVSKMKGKEGTKVNISIVREGETDPIDFTIVRQEIEVPTIEYKMLEDGIGYVVITEFDEITVTQFKAAIDKLEKDGMKGLVVDVRNNPGGLLDSVVKILDRLLPKGLIVYTEDKYGKRDPENAEDDIKLDIPMAVLINGNSASASEIFAGTLQDYKAATIVGTTSFGKGIVQKVIPLSDGTAVKLTISKYYTPKGRNIHKTGITPDVEIELDEEMKKEVTIPVEKDNQLQKAIKVLKNKIKK